MNSNFIPWGIGECLFKGEEVVPDFLVFEKVFRIEGRCSCQNQVFLEAECDRDNYRTLDAVTRKRVVDFVPKFKRANGGEGFLGKNKLP